MGDPEAVPDPFLSERRPAWSVKFISLAKAPARPRAVHFFFDRVCYSKLSAMATFDGTFCSCPSLSIEGSCPFVLAEKGHTGPF